MKIIQSLSVFNAEYVLGSFLLDDRKLFKFKGQQKCWCFFRKNKAFTFVQFLFRRDSHGDHLNVVTTIIYIYFDYKLVKNMQ